ncbi:hypothetical protein DCAR_0101534 [Daucus carota subsp. sativus]|uniref:Uncharacterized protein n=1 Tax=Daucus carota subsp. sativus TaxID=79200 RepID=A0A162AGX4_DAUCS|nr:hypothetical protein DCAR_0101534 [Daucus carota subsp. sativus]
MITDSVTPRSTITFQALDEFLHKRVSKLQQRGDDDSCEHHTARHAFSRIYRGPSIQTILDWKSKGISNTTSIQSDTKKRGYGPGVNKLISSPQQENEPPKEIPQVYTLSSILNFCFDGPRSDLLLIVLTTFTPFGYSGVQALLGSADG